MVETYSAPRTWSQPLRDSNSNMEMHNFSLGSSASSSKDTDSLDVRSDTQEVQHQELPSDVIEELVRTTRSSVFQMMLNSKFLKKNCRIGKIQRFDLEDLELGGSIGRGGFSDVHEIVAFKKEEPQGKKERDRYVIKSLHAKMGRRNPKKFVFGARDLAMEAIYLSSFKHENIIELRGWPSSGVEGFRKTGRPDGFFLIYDRLEDTLRSRISNWRHRLLNGDVPTPSSAFRLSNNSVGSTVKIEDTLKMFFKERIKVAISIASAMEYLHKNLIIYRDLKPANVGFDSNGVLKIFDFGLASTLPDGSDPYNQTFKLTGGVGTTRYMAIEVMRKQSYNCKADVFSFTVLLWEMMTLTKPFQDFSCESVMDSVTMNNERPPLPPSWPTELRQLMHQGWVESLSERLTMPAMRQQLDHIKDTCKVEGDCNSSPRKSPRRMIRRIISGKMAATNLSA